MAKFMISRTYLLKRRQMQVCFASLFCKGVICQKRISLPNMSQARCAIGAVFHEAEIIIFDTGGFEDYKWHSRVPRQAPPAVVPAAETGNTKSSKMNAQMTTIETVTDVRPLQFDDKSHMGDADPEVTKKCGRDLERLKCFEQKSFEDVIECLRVDYDNLEPDCKAMIFQREKIEAVDNTFDDELQKGCKYDIGKFCSSQQGEKVLDCLSNMKIVRLLQKNCQKIVQERMLERVKDDRLNPGLLEAYQFEAQEHCRKDYNKINDHRYEKQQLGSIIASCLRTKFSQFGGKGIHLNPQCQDEVTKVILESEFDVQLDPALYKACKSTIPKHCSNAIISKSGNFDSVLECLKADFYTNQIQDADCARQLSRRTQESLVDIHLDPSLHEACSMDIQRICRDTIPGQSRIIMCLMDALQVPQITISSACRNKLTERQRLWNMAHDEYKMALPETWHDVYNIVANHPHRTSILTWLGGVLLVLLLLGCCCGRWTKRIHSELKNR